MSVTYESYQQIGPTTWYVAVSSTESDPTYRWYLDGVLILTGPQSWRYIDVGEGSFQLEVRDDASAAAEAYPAYAILSWQTVTDADNWRVEQYVEDAWTLKRTIADNGQSAFRYQTDELTDGTAYQFRAVPVNAEGIQGTAREWSFTCVRRPAAPSVGYTYTGAVSKTVTIAAA